MSDGRVDAEPSVRKQIRGYLGLWRIHCPFAPFPSKERIESNLALEEAHLRWTYNYWPGYAHQAIGPPDSVTWKKRWTSTRDDWWYRASPSSPKVTVNIIASDLMRSISWSPKAQFNHPGEAGGELSVLDGSNLEFARAIRERSAPASDILPQVPANYAYLDGSVRHVRGDDPSVIEYPLRWKPRRGSEAHWISTLE